ncbi:DUF4956 domain-containing protein [Cellulomonas massiliensis]|uniref:DUF4956 domain-containing protein n=1 Tax=Cellulomonas massiliensis TaxID=1465811 RepID=UPI00031B9266|nr:DUF4956 domain-containing protein [Cellulomonas massiliensis]
MTPYLLYAADVVAIAVLAFAVYLPRHRRRDLVVAYVGVNVGVLAVAAVLADSTIAAGLGLGLFGVLSIIRLRSIELSQTEVAYYFAALALGLIAGLAVAPLAVSLGLMALLVAVLAVVDSRRVMARYREQVLVLDRAVPDETALTAYVERTLGARVHAVQVQRLDLVNDTTTVAVRYRLDERPATVSHDLPAAAAATHAGAAR